MRPKAQFGTNRTFSSLRSGGSLTLQQRRKDLLHHLPCIRLAVDGKDPVGFLLTGRFKNGPESLVNLDTGITDRITGGSPIPQSLSGNGFVKFDVEQVDAGPDHPRRLAKSLPLGTRAEIRVENHHPAGTTGGGESAG